MTRAASFLAVLLTVGALAGCGGGSHPSAPKCTTVSMPKMGPRKAPKPTAKLDPAETYTITMSTNCGSFSFVLDQKQSPNASASFVSLVQHAYFDKTIFHRIVTGFIIQGGDPTATGLGTPGYSTVDTPPASAIYTLGTVAMAKGGNQPAGTAGSQFFVVTTASSGLTPVYAIIGKVSSGLAVVKLIGRQGTADEQGTPTAVVEISKASVKVS
jgi:peptidyl-prolyl cis-trans isomerase B (cyclophilin B)